jgi:hypothetical protein
VVEEKCGLGSKTADGQWFVNSIGVMFKLVTMGLEIGCGGWVGRVGGLSSELWPFSNSTSRSISSKTCTVMDEGVKLKMYGDGRRGQNGNLHHP